MALLMPWPSDLKHVPRTGQLQANSTGPDVAGPPYPDCSFLLAVYQGLYLIPGYNAGKISESSILTALESSDYEMCQQVKSTQQGVTLQSKARWR